MIHTKLIPRTPEANEPPLLIKSLLAQSAKYEPQREIVYRDLFRINYTQFNQRVRQLANALTKLGIKPGDTVAVLDWDSHRYLECFFGVTSLGAILHTVNIRLSPAQILYTMNHAEDKAVLIHEDFLPILNAIKGQLQTVDTYVVLSDKVYNNATETQPLPELPEGFAGEYEALLKEASTEYDFPDFDENTWATTFYTTGTTGNPKGVYFSHRQLFMHTMGLLTYLIGYEALPFKSRNDVYMPITPMFHVHAWGFPFLATLMSAKQVYPGKYEPEMLCRLIVTEGVTLSHCVPTILTMLVGSPAAQKFRENLSRWSVLIGGSALTKGLAKAAMELGINILAGYGMSETAPILTVVYLNDSERTLPLDEQIDLRVRAGRIAPFVEARLMDDEGNFVPHDGHSLGEIVVRTPWTTQGYYNDQERGAELWRGGWLHTGDVASITPDNWVMIADRTKDVIKTGGEWVSSLDMENELSQIEGVAESAVVGLPDDRWGERPYALIVQKPGFTLSTESIRASLQTKVDRGELHKWYVPDRIVFVPEIPKTSVGKIDKKRIRSEMKEQLLGS
ncbi:MULTISPECIES: fatty acid--CoA ligase [unclassified Spirosoma]|uniref:fatty acid--CoA ligase n=1 Tax=unclassified Spirosoma TaxID=2621999 RepID=UPI000959D722|nr:MULTISPECIES: fatty acid--CoA ligase [unclassified Spirosoma]MBN8823672.1 fatty acid--CoA ligase [Spirosoma sp.]OJW76777.1 MAG: long-chain fatty acid--CoA ligase [Spirosoma sp. 48-14]